MGEVLRPSSIQHCAYQVNYHTTMGFKCVEMDMGHHIIHTRFILIILTRVLQF